MKKFIKIIFVLSSMFLISLVFSACSNTSSEDTNKNFTLLFTNDIHAETEPFIYRSLNEERLVGGFANIASYVNSVEEEKGEDNVLFVDAGDYFTGPSVSTLTNGEAIIDIMNTMNYDIATVGNHEFDYGWDNTLTQLNKAEFNVVQGNIFVEETDELFWDNPYELINMNGVDVGVIGLHGDFAFTDTVTETAREGLVCKEEEEYLKKYVDELSDKADIIILLVHEGVPGKQSSSKSTDVERSLQKDMELAEKVPGVDIIVTGHAHVGTSEPIKVNDTLIVSTDARGSEVGKIDLTVNTKDNEITDYKYELKTIYDDEWEANPETQATIDKWVDEVKSIMEKNVGKTEVTLTRSYGDDSLLGNLSADSLKYAMVDYSPDFAVMNSGGLRADIEKGDITYGEVIDVVPFPNELVVAEYTGAQVRALFEHAAGLTNGILQVSDGVKMTYDESLPVGSRVTEILINGEALEEDKVYKIATIDFLANGGDGFETFKEGENRKTRGGYMLYTAVADYITHLNETNQMPTSSDDRIIVK